jgi:hypothetical protein
MGLGLLEIGALVKKFAAPVQPPSPTYTTLMGF